MNESALHELPRGWVWTKLGEIAEKIVDGTHFTPKYVSSGVPFISVKDIRNSKISFDDCRYISQDEHETLIKRCNPEYNDVLITKSGTIGRTAVIKTNKIFSLFVSVALIKPFKNYLDSDLISLILENYINNIDISQSIKGGVIKNFHLEDLKLVDFPLPPLPEQRRIVTKLEELFTRLDAGVSELKKTQVQLKRYRQSVLKAACEGKLVPTEAELAKAEGREYETVDVLLAQILKERREKWNGKGKYKEPGAPETSGLMKLPEGWGWANVGQMADSMKNGIYKPSEFYTEDGFACLRMYNIDGGKIVWKDIKRMNLSKEEIDEFLLLPGDLLVNRVNSRELVGKAAVIPLGIEKCVFESKNIRVRVLDEIVNPYYLCFRLASVGSEYFNRNAQQVVGMASISQPQIARFPVPLPPLAEQNRIVLEVERRLSIADGVEKTVAQSLAQAQRLRQSILKKAFEGRLVAQDASDEPAGMLLEKIRQQKQIKEKNNKTTKRKTHG